MPDKLTSRNSLARSLIIKISWRLISVIIISSLISLWFFKKTETSKELDFLSNYISIQSESERHLFEQAINDVEFIKFLYEDQIISNKAKKDFNKNVTLFNKITEVFPDKATRTKPEYLNAETDPAIFITKNIKYSDQKKNEIILGYQTIKDNYNVWANRYVNTWMVYDGHVSLTLSPKRPNVIYEMDAAFTDSTEDYYTITDIDKNPKREGKWTNLYFDPNYKSWMISFTTPILKNDKKIGAVGVDIFLEELFSRILNVHLPDSYNFIISGDGKLIVHPNYIEAIQKSNGKLGIQSIKNPILNQAYKIIQNLKNQKKNLFELPQSNLILGVGKIPETNWYLVTVFTQKYLENKSKNSLYLVLLSSAAYLLIELLILYITLKQGLSRPLNNFVGKISKILLLKKNIQFPIEREDEIGELAKTFTSLQKTLEIRDQKVKEYTENLEILVQERTNKLEKTLKESNQVLEKSIQAAKLATLGEVASGLSHELNSPIMVLKGTAHQIQKGLDQKNLDIERFTHLIERLKGTTKKMTDSVNSLRIFSRNPNLDEMKPTTLQNVFTSALNICYEKFRFHQIQITITPENYQEIEFFGKETQLAHAILNLLNNSFDAISNRQEKWVKIDISEENGTIIIDIFDSGPLIPGELTEKIFIPYFTTKIGQNSTGLGLSIAQKILEEHHGLIFYTKKDGFNHFIISLPKRSDELIKYKAKKQE